MRECVWGGWVRACMNACVFGTDHIIPSVTHDQQGAATTRLKTCSYTDTKKQAVYSMS